MKIDPAKTKLVLIAPCQTCKGTRKVTVVKKWATGNQTVYDEPCTDCNKSGEDAIEMTLAEFVAHLAAMREVNGNVTQDIPIKWKDMP